jgi:fructokinase
MAAIVSELCGGVETGGTWCACAVGTGPDDIVVAERFPTTAPKATLDRIAEFFRRAPGIRALGIGSFGPLDLNSESPTWGYITSTPKPGWQHISVAPALRDALDVPVAFASDVDAAAVGEHRWGAGQGRSSLCYLTVGTGIGAGLLIDGRPWHGLIHPEVGHLRIPHDGSFPGVCPVHGDCWEGLASGPAIAARWGQPADALPDDHPAWALEADHLALGILSIVSVFSPLRVIAGGGVMQRPALIEMVGQRLCALNAGYLETPLLGDQIEDFIVVPQLGDRAGVLGALALAGDVLG